MIGIVGPGLDGVAPVTENGHVPPAPRRRESAGGARRLRRIPRTGGVVAYDAGRHSRTELDWNPTNAGPNRLAEETLPLARRRIRDLVDNNPIVAGARYIIRSNVVGTGISPQPNTEWDDLNKQIEDLWEEARDGVDLERCEACSQSQERFFDEMFAAGDCLVNYPIVPRWNEYDAGPAIELIDSDRVDFQKNEFLKAAANAGRRVRQGVEFDELGHRTAYHVLLDHPEDVGVLSGGLGLIGRETVRVAARNATLGFVPRRINQIRGVPWPVVVAGSVRMEDKFQEAMLLLARAAACVGLYLSGADTESVMEANDQDLDDPQYCVSPEGDPITRLQAGLIGLLPKDIEPHLLSPNVPGPTFEQTTQILLRRMASGLGISYSTLSRDFTKATYAATRSEQLEDRKGYRPLQARVWKLHTQGHYERVIRWGIASNRIKLTGEQRRVWRERPRRLYKVIVIAPGWEWVDPQREAKADEIAVDMDAKSLPEICAGRGRDWKDVIDENIRAEVYRRERREAAGLTSEKPARPSGDGVDSDKADEDEPGNDDEERNE